MNKLTDTNENENSWLFESFCCIRHTIATVEHYIRERCVSVSECTHIRFMVWFLAVQSQCLFESKTWKYSNGDFMLWPNESLLCLQFVFILLHLLRAFRNILLEQNKVELLKKIFECTFIWKFYKTKVCLSYDCYLYEKPEWFNSNSTQMHIFQKKWYNQQWISLRTP